YRAVQGHLLPGGQLAVPGPIPGAGNQVQKQPEEHLHQRAVGLSAGAELSSATAGSGMNWSERLEQLALPQEQREAFLERVRVQVAPEDYRHIESLCQLAAAIGKDNLSKLQHLLFGRKTETTDRVCPVVETVAEPAPAAPPKPPPKGHGRCGA